ncbi:MAG: NACHT domain-containing protein [Thermoguttaceae bacterium]|jgi:hypothetical protein
MDSKQQNPEQEQRDSNCSSGPPNGGFGTVQDRVAADPELVAQVRAYLEQVVERIRDQDGQYIRPDVYRMSKANVLDESDDESDAKDDDSESEPERIPWESECERALHTAVPWRAVVLGAPGQGKTSLLMRLARQLARAGLEALQGPSPDVGKVPLPAFVYLDGLSTIPRDKGEPWSDFLPRALTLLLSPSSPNLGMGIKYPILGKALEYIVQSAKTRSVWLLLDALDEASDPSNLIKMLQPLENWDCNVILSSRPHAYEGTRLPFKATEYRLAPLSPRQTIDFQRKRLPSHELQEKLRQILETSPIKQMATNPLLLNLLSEFVDRHGVRDKVNYSELYKDVLRHFVGGPAGGRLAIDYERDEAWLPLLANAAWNLMWKVSEDGTLLQLNSAQPPGKPDTPPHPSDYKVEKTESKAAKERGKWAKKEPPPPNSPWRHGYVEGSLTELAAKMGMKYPRELRKRHEHGSLWIEGLGPRKYRVWFTDESEYIKCRYGR